MTYNVFSGTFEPYSINQSINRTLAAELVVLDETDLLALHAPRRLTSRTARLNRMTLKILGQPAQVAVADERIASQVSAVKQHYYILRES